MNAEKYRKYQQRMLKKTMNLRGNATDADLELLNSALVAFLEKYPDQAEKVASVREELSKRRITRGKCYEIVDMIRADMSEGKNHEA